MPGVFPVATLAELVVGPAPASIPGAPPGITVLSPATEPTMASPVYVQGFPIAVVGDSATSHGLPPPAGNPICQAGPASNPVITGIPTVLVNGLPIAVVGSTLMCGHQISAATGAGPVVPTVFVGGELSSPPGIT